MGDRRVKTAQDELELAQRALRLPAQSPSRWHRAGLTRRGERIFDVLSWSILVALGAGWSWTIAEARAEGVTAGSGALVPVTASVSAALTRPDAPSVAYLTQVALEKLVPLRGVSGRLRADIRPAGAALAEDSLPAGVDVQYASGSRAESATVSDTPEEPGVWDLALRVGSVIRPVADFRVITMLPFERKRRGRIGLYYIGTWPTEGSRAARAGYAPPAGFIEVTLENQNTSVSEHFRLRDFLTKDQRDVWPKYLVLDMKLIDKLELVLADLHARGHDVSGVRVMSGFRTPQYNVGGGDPRGRASLSRHMFGDAADIYFDLDGTGRWDDLNGDGRVDVRDMRVVEAAVDRVERAHPALVGGVGLYAATSAHGPFIHIDTRGYRARWVESGGGG